MRIEVDFNLCEGHGLCAYEAPGVFDLGDDGKLVVLDETPAQTMRAQVEGARASCPTGAIGIRE